jgi:hypothetical protein
MAIDTERKRKSAATVSAVWNGPSVVPDGTIDGPDRQHIGWSYSGIAASAPGGIAFSIFYEEGVHSNVFGGVIIR